jgi:two-component system sensor histidine kinase PilS (NtrC family)
MAQLNDYVIQHMNTGVLAVDADNSIRMMNETAWRLLGQPEIRVGNALRDSAAELAERVASWRDNPTTPVAPFRPQAGGRELQPELTSLGSGPDSGALIFLEDLANVTAQAQQLKLASLGRLTASIAHEIRNPLGAISHAGQLLAESPELDKGDRRLTEIIKSNSTRVNDIIETVLQLSRRQGAKLEHIELESWLAKFVEDFDRNHISAPNQLLNQVAASGLQIEADPGQLQQILGNLCENALKYANNGVDPVVITLEGGFNEEQRDPILCVIDQGPGIAAENLRQIFEPFFTTGNKSTGLGLYITKELCETNKIDLDYLPIATGGSCFRLSFRGWKRNESEPGH